MNKIKHKRVSRQLTLTCLSGLITPNPSHLFQLRIILVYVSFRTPETKLAPRALPILLILQDSESVPVNFRICVPLLLFCSSTSYWSHCAVKQEGNQESFMLPRISGWWSSKHHGSVMNCTQQDVLWLKRLISLWLSTFWCLCVACGAHRSLVNKSNQSRSSLSGYKPVSG